jgi:DNA-binding XRE family transcriptional regulator
MTQEELALKSDITVRTIQRIENGEVGPQIFYFTSHRIGIGSRL